MHLLSFLFLLGFFSCSDGGRVPLSNIVGLETPAAENGFVFVCCEPGEEFVEIARIRIFEFSGRPLALFWITPEVVGPLRFMRHSDSLDPQAVVSFSTAAEIQRAARTTPNITLVVFAERCDWFEVSFTLGAENDDNDHGKRTFRFRNTCAPIAPAPGDDVVTQVPVPELLRDPTSLITRTGPGDPTFATGVLWQDVTQLAGATNPQVLFPRTEGLVAHELRRTVDRTQAAFASASGPLVDDGIATEDRDLFHLDMDTGDVRRLTRFREQGRSVVAHVWSRDGTRILMRVIDPTAPDGSATLEILDVTTKELTRVASFTLPETGFGLSGPAWSRDGNKIAYCLQGHVNVIDLAAGTDTRIVENANAFDPNWHPTEDKIVYVTGESGLRIVDSEGTLLSSLPGGAQPEWSWDATRIVAASGPDVIIVDVETGEVTTLPDSEGPKYHDW